MDARSLAKLNDKTTTIADIEVEWDSRSQCLVLTQEDTRDSITMTKQELGTLLKWLEENVP